MPSYTVLPQAGRGRLVRITGTTSAVVTTVGDPTAAARVADALTTATSDIAHWAAYYLLDQTDTDHLDPDTWRYAGGDQEWRDLPAPTTPFSLRRRVLNALDGDTTDTSLESALGPLRAALSGQPESVVRAVRDEVADAYRPYDGVWVLARAYDYKWHDVDTPFLANAGLELLEVETLDRLRTAPHLGAVQLLDALTAAGLADFAYAAQVDAAGYLRVDVNAAQLAAWRASRGH